MKTIVKEITWLKGMNHGWGCGYAIIPKGHPMHGKHYNDIPVDVHGGLTFGSYAKDLDWPELSDEDTLGWVVGFDTAYLNDTIHGWPKEAVEFEARNLAEQLAKLK